MRNHIWEREERKSVISYEQDPPPRPYREKMKSTPIGAKTPTCWTESEPLGWRLQRPPLLRRSRW